MTKKRLVVLHKEDPEYIRKTLNGLIRGSDRYTLQAVIDLSGTLGVNDAGELLDGQPAGIPILHSLRQVVEQTGQLPDHFMHTWYVRPQDGELPPDLKRHVIAALESGVTLVNVSHFHLGGIAELAETARRGGAEIIDLRKPGPMHELAAWSEGIFDVKAPRIPVLGTDQAVGKRTSCRWLTQACTEAGIKAQMIYTGQTGWLQGGEYGCILDSLPLDFAAGELVKEILRCDRERSPEVIFVEGQSAITHPSQPIGAQFLRPIGATGAILQHVPGREFNIDTPCRLVPVEQHIRIIEALGARVLAVALNGELEPRGAVLEPGELIRHQKQLSSDLGIPVIRPLEEGMEELVGIVRGHIADCAR